MDPNQITTTFIPKKPIEEVIVNTPGRSSAPAGTLFIIAIIVLILTIISVGGLFFYNNLTRSEITTLQESLEKNEKQYEPNLLVDLTALDRRLKNGNALINQHIAISPIFDLIEQYTLKTVRFSKFEFKTSDTGSYVVTLSGEADNYQSIALQSQNFGDISAFKGVIFSDFTLTPKNRISFNTSFTISPEILNFKTAPLKSNTIIKNTTPVLPPSTVNTSPTSQQVSPSDTQTSSANVLPPAKGDF
jgi:hypothetical protein